MEPPATARPRIRLPWWSGLVALPLLGAAAVLGLEQRIELLGDGSTVYLKRVPGDEVRYRLDANAAWMPAALDAQGYSYALDFTGRMRRRGLLPIQISYRTRMGFRRTKWVAFDVDQSISAHYEMGFWSGGALDLARFDKDGSVLRVDDFAGCVKYRYGFDGEAATRPVAIDTFDIAVPAGVKSVTVRPVPCAKAHVCAVTFFRDGRESEISGDDCQSR